ncbi:hypothetical protein ACQRBV_03125 [Pseudomonas sp. R11F]|uniref:hypothetical protein n=1 Tax=Pseudomonas TaxID=286 RepID=UPI00398F46AA
MRAVIELKDGQGICLVTPQSTLKVTSKRTAVGVYEIRGTLGLIPVDSRSNGWGYSMGNDEKDVSAVISYARKIMTVKLFKQGQPHDLVGAMSLHAELPEPVCAVVPAF